MGRGRAEGGQKLHPNMTLAPKTSLLCPKGTKDGPGPVGLCPWDIKVAEPVGPGPTFISADSAFGRQTDPSRLGVASEVPTLGRGTVSGPRPLLSSLGPPKGAKYLACDSRLGRPPNGWMSLATPARAQVGLWRQTQGLNVRPSRMPAHLRDSGHCARPPGELATQAHGRALKLNIGPGPKRQCCCVCTGSSGTATTQLPMPYDLKLQDIGYVPRTSWRLCPKGTPSEGTV